jgi:FkbM family methyltransferase
MQVSKPNLFRRFSEAIVFMPALLRRGSNPISRLLISSMCREYGVRCAVQDATIELSKDDRLIRMAHSQFVHALELSRQFDLYFSQVLPERVGSLQIVDYSRPKLHRYAQSGLEFELSSFPEEQSAIDDYFRWYTPKLGDVIFDVGAYCGVSTYHFSKLVGSSGRVFAFEPDPTNYPILLRNVERHGLKNVTALNLAIAGSNGVLKFNSEGTTGSGLSRSMTRVSLSGVTDVNAITLEQACSQFGFPQFAKIDVEGAEIEIVESSRQFLRSHPMQLVLDTSHKVDGKLTVRPVERLFAECEYETFSSDECGYMTTWARARATFSTLRD